MTLNNVFGFSTLIFFFLVGCVKTDVDTKTTIEPTNRIIQFSGYDWEVRTASKTKAGPGPNYFSNANENVWVDNSGRLHLAITQKNGKWMCAGVTLLKAVGYGRYIFYTESRTDKLDKNIVAGLFLYQNDTKEIDIEFSKWGKENNLNAQYVIQPGTTEGNKSRFNLLLNNIKLTNIIDWHSDKISFLNESSTQQPIHSWSYTGKNIPSDKDDLAVKINLWLFKAVPPSDTAYKELIISSFKYIPQNL